MNCRFCISELVCRYNDGISDWCKGDCPQFKERSLTWLLPHCEQCGHPIHLEVTQYRCVNSIIRIATEFEPECCPNCQMLINGLEVDFENKLCIAKGWNKAK
jgi:hypothetical protein